MMLHFFRGYCEERGWVFWRFLIVNAVKDTKPAASSAMRIAIEGISGIVGVSENTIAMSCVLRGVVHQT